MTDAPLVVVTNWVHQEVLDRLSRHCRVIANADREPWPADILRKHVASADALIAFMPDRIGDVFLDAAPRLRLIACALKGYDNFDLAACTARGVLVTVVEDLLTAPSAELAIGLMIALGRHMLPADRMIRTEGFAGWRPRFYGTGLAGSTVGIIGMGAIGRAIATRLRGFDCAILCHDTLSPPTSGLEFVDLDALLERSDIIVLALPLTAATHHIIDAARIARMRPGALLVNPARGSLVDEDAVAAALAGGQLGGYAADVFACEDWAQADRPPAIHPGILASERTVLTPHLGSAVEGARRAIAEAAANSVLDLFAAKRQPRGSLNWQAVQG
jgi:phosphonate dehydrogenase